MATLCSPLYAVPLLCVPEAEAECTKLLLLHDMKSGCNAVLYLHGKQQL